MTVAKITSPITQNELIAKTNEIIDNLGGGGVAPVWGNITGTLSNQTDLQGALDEKQDKLTSQNAGDGINIYEYYPDAVEIDYHAMNSSGQYVEYEVANPSAWVASNEGDIALSITDTINNLSSRSFEYVLLVPYIGRAGMGLGLVYNYSSSLLNRNNSIWINSDAGYAPSNSSFCIASSYQNTGNISITSSEYSQIQEQGGIWFKITSDGNGNYGAYYSIDNNNWVEIVFTNNTKFSPTDITCPCVGKFATYGSNITFDLTQATFQYTPARDPYVKIEVASTVYQLIDALTARVTALETNINGGNA